MSNYCLNELRIVGDKEDILRFDNCFKNNGIRFVVDRHLLTASGYAHFNLSKYLCYYSAKNGDGFKLVGLNSIEMMNDYSFSAFVPPSVSDLKTWDDWTVSKWGTFSDVLEMSVKKINNLCIEYNFKTIMPPLAVMDQLIIDFPMLNFEWKYAEDCQSYAGKIIYEEGELVENTQLFENSQEMRQFLKENFNYEYMICPSCESLLQEHEAEEEFCPLCNKQIDFADNGELIIVLEETNDGGDVDE